MSSVRYSAAFLSQGHCQIQAVEAYSKGETVYCPASTACHFLRNVCYGGPGRGQKSLLILEDPAWFSRGRGRVVVSPG